MFAIVVLLFCAETLPEVRCSPSVIALISNTFGDCAGFKCVGYFEHNIHLLICLEKIEKITILCRFNVCMTTFLNFSPVRQYKKKLIAKFQ